MSKQNIHIAMGSLAYAIAKADGQIQPEEIETIKKLAQKEFELDNVDTEWIETMFTRLEKDKVSLDDAYQYAVDTLKANQYEFDFDAEMKNRCMKFMQRTAEAFQGTSNIEQSIIDKFQKEIDNF